MDEGAHRPLRLGMVGIGKIARDQHAPAVRADPAFVLAATASHAGRLEGIPAFPDIGRMIDAVALDAICLCTPPSARLEPALLAIGAGLHLMVEKPPASSVREAMAIEAAARNSGVGLYFAWHSRMAAGVRTAARWCRENAVERVTVHWHEDIREWHPGQDWLLAPGGFGVFDPGINALSILTRILPGRLTVRRAVLSIPENRAAPIAVRAELDHAGAPVDVSFDFLHPGEPVWRIELEATGGRLLLDDGGARLALDGREIDCPADGEYPALYSAFADLCRSRAIDADFEPLALVADMMLIGRRRSVGPFRFDGSPDHAA